MATMTYVPSRIGEGFFIDVPTPGSGDNAKALTYNHATGAFVYTAFDASGTAAAAVATHVALSDPHTQYELESANDAAAILTKLLTVDGAGSGLDADLLDGQSSAYYLPASSFVPPGSTTQVLFNDGGAWGGDAGLTYAKATDQLTVTGGLVAPSIRPASNSTTALQFQNASGTAVATVDTANTRIGIGTTSPQRLLHVVGSVQFGSVTTGSSTGGRLVCYDAANATIYSVGPNAGFQLWLNDTPTQAARYIMTGVGDMQLGVYNGTAWATALQIVNSSSYIGTHGVTAPTALFHVAASTTARSSLRIAAGVAPTTPNAGDIWDDGALVAYNSDATTAAVVNSLKLRRGSSGTPAAGFGLGIAARLESSSTEDRDAGRLTWEWVTATDVSRASRGKLSAYSTTTEQEAIRWDGDSGGVKLAFYGGTPVAKAAAYTQTYATADRTLSAYTADNESSAYTGIDNAQGGTVYAQLTDLNAARVALENLRVFTEDLAQLVNSVVDDMQAINLVG